MKKIPEIIIEISRKLRKEMTEVEKILWDKLKAKQLNGVKFLRQPPLYVFTEYGGLDRYIIPDFLCREYKIIIELDGNIHNIKEVHELDIYKQKLLKNMGYKILRFKNEEIHNDLNNTLIKIVASFSWQGERIQERGKNI